MLCSVFHAVKVYHNQKFTMCRRAPNYFPTFTISPVLDPIRDGKKSFVILFFSFSRTYKKNKRSLVSYKHALIKVEETGKDKTFCCKKYSQLVKFFGKRRRTARNPSVRQAFAKLLLRRPNTTFSI